jgi:tetratricopeptide (TPR) repeat protein
VDRAAYRAAWRNGRRVVPAAAVSTTSGSTSSTWHGSCGTGYDGHHGTHYHHYYDDHHWYLSFHFGAAWGPWFGVSYYYPYHSWVYGCDYAFFYPYPVAWCYAPYGFYWRYEPLYVTRYEVVRRTVPVYVYEQRTVVTEEQAAGGEAGPVAAPAEDAEPKVADPKPAAGSPATEKFLREASERFRKKDYYEAAVRFRLAALSSPDLPGPLFALGQALVALGHDEYAARVLRKAVNADPRILEETGDIAGVYESREEFDRVLTALEARAAAAPVDGDARFLLGLQRYFAGDPRCRETFALLAEARPEDEAVNRFRAAVEKRFLAADELPPLPAR